MSARIIAAYGSAAVAAVVIVGFVVVVILLSRLTWWRRCMLHNFGGRTGIFGGASLSSFSAHIAVSWRSFCCVRRV